MQKRNVLNSPRLLELKKRRRRIVLNKIFISLFGVLIIFILLAYLSCIDSLNITEIQIEGNKIVNTEALKIEVEKQIAGKYLWLFPKTNILYYPQNSIKNNLQNKFTRLKNINLSIQNNKILLVSVSEREPKYTWCGANEEGNDNQNCYFLDENGYIFDKAPYFSGEVYFKFYGVTDVGIPQSGSPTSVTGSYFSKQNFKQLISFKDILFNIGLKPIALWIKENGDIEVSLLKSALSSTVPKIIFRANADFQNVAENLEAALTTEPLQSKFKNNYSSLQYIDLRFGNKVFNKFSK